MLIKHLLMAIQRRQAQRPSRLHPLWLTSLRYALISTICAPSRLLHDVDVHCSEEVLQGVYDRRQPVVLRGEILLQHTFCDLRLVRGNIQFKLDCNEPNVTTANQPTGSSSMWAPCYMQLPSHGLPEPKYTNRALIHKQDNVISHAASAKAMSKNRKLPVLISRDTRWKRSVLSPLPHLPSTW